MSIALSLNELENSGLIRQAQIEPELEYIFRHALVQDASYESLLKADRRALHATVAQTLEQLYPARLDEISATLADHYERAEIYPKALDYYLRAGKAAAKLYANAEAILLFARAIELLAIPESHAATKTAKDLFSEYGRVLELSGKYKSAIENYRQMQAEAIRRRERGMEMDALIAQAIIQATPSPVHNIPQAQLLCEQALGIAQAMQDREAESRIYWILLLAHYFFQDNKKSVEYGKKSLEIARAIDHRERLAFTLNDIARSYYAIGDFDNANAAIVEARALWEELGNLPMLADNLIGYATATLLIGNPNEALALTQRAYKIAEKINNDWGKGHSLSIQARANWYQGDASACLQCFDGIKELPSVQNLPFVSTMGASLLMELYIEMGCLDQAQDVVNTMGRVVEFANGILNGFHELASATVASARGDMPAALEYLNFAKQKMSTVRFNTFAPLYFGMAEYRIGMASQQYAGLVENISGVISELQQSRVNLFIPTLKYWRGNALLHDQRADEARAELLSALELSERCQTRHTTWKIHAALAELFPAAESFHHEKARETIQYIAEHTPENLRAAYLNLPEIQKITSAL